MPGVPKNKCSVPKDWSLQSLLAKSGHSNARMTGHLGKTDDFGPYEARTQYEIKVGKAKFLNACQ